MKMEERLLGAAAGARGGGMVEGGGIEEEEDGGGGIDTGGASIGDTSCLFFSHSHREWRNIFVTEPLVPLAVPPPLPSSSPRVSPI